MLIVAVPPSMYAALCIAFAVTFKVVYACVVCTFYQLQLIAGRIVVCVTMTWLPHSCTEHLQIF
jgi:hypothetical protein